MLAPALAVYLLFAVYPMLDVVHMSFARWNGLTPDAPFVGFDNYRAVLTEDTVFWGALKNTVIWTAVAVTVPNLISFGLALALFLAFTLHALWVVTHLETAPGPVQAWMTPGYIVRSYGIPSLSDSREIRIGLQLAQEELAQLLGASRQRVNQELKAMEREEAIRIEPGGLVVRNRDALLRICEADTER